MTEAYLQGVLHDGTKRKTTYRIAQKGYEYIKFLAQEIRNLGFKAWTYQEGKNRSVYIVEFSHHVMKRFQLSTQQEKIDYIRGYFDAEGGIAKTSKVRFYIYFAQKDKNDLEEVKSYLKEIGISCGTIHNPSKKADPNYWRFFIRKKSYKDFAKKIGSWHPEKNHSFRMMI